MILMAGATSRADTTGGTSAPLSGEAGAPATGGSQPPGAAAPLDGALVARITALPTELATWYGPGFFGKRTACGIVLRRSTQGVAHRKLPCGTPVTLYYAGHLKTVPVVDRGPFSRRVRWDITQATARDLGIRRTSHIRALH